MESEKTIAFGFIKTHTPCTACGNPLVINGPGPVFLCNYCQTEVNLGKKVMISLIEGIYDIAGPLEPKTNSTTLFMEGHSFQLTYGRGGLPLCPSCGEAQARELFRISSDKDCWEIPCAKCGVRISVTKLPKWLRDRFPGMEIAVNAVPAVPDGEKEKPAIEGVFFGCPKCGANLEVDGIDRIVHCSFCGGNVYLPDDLWLRLHPVKKINTWWIGLSSTKKMVNFENKVKTLAIKTENLKKDIVNKENSRRELQKKIEESSRELESLGVFEGQKKRELKENLAGDKAKLEKIEQWLSGLRNKSDKAYNQLKNAEERLKNFQG
ncbi:MAG: hypothetical protein E4H36_09055 [Spirochaetales bacterium]|nr:MAG: hypothetical protein E4H36_09055 [Spirochaetales bacterium]